MRPPGPGGLAVMRVAGAQGCMKKSAFADLVFLLRAVGGVFAASALFWIFVLTAGSV